MALSQRHANLARPKLDQTIPHLLGAVLILHCLELCLGAMDAIELSKMVSRDKSAVRLSKSVSAKPFGPWVEAETRLERGTSLRSVAALWAPDELSGGPAWATESLRRISSEAVVAAGHPC